HPASDAEVDGRPLDEIEESAHRRIDGTDDESHLAEGLRELFQESGVLAEVGRVNRRRHLPGFFRDRVVHRLRGYVRTGALSLPGMARCISEQSRRNQSMRWNREPSQ